MNDSLKYCCLIQMRTKRLTILKVDNVGCLHVDYKLINYICANVRWRPLCKHLVKIRWAVIKVQHDSTQIAYKHGIVSLRIWLYLRILQIDRCKDDHALWPMTRWKHCGGSPLFKKKYILYPILSNKLFRKKSPSYCNIV